MEETTIEMDTGGNPVQSSQQAESKDPPQPSFVTADDLKKTVDSMFANMRRMVESISKPKQEGKKVGKESTETQVDLSAELALRDSFDDAVSGRQLTRDTLKRLRKSFMTERPEDPSSWVDEFLTAFQPTAKDETVSTKPDTPKGPPTSDAGANIGTPVWERPSNPFTWSEDDLQRIYAQKGKAKGRRFIREKAEEYLRGKRITGLKPAR